MNDFYKSLFSKAPDEILDGDYYFHADGDGDQFDEKDVDIWFAGGAFKRAWTKRDAAKNDAIASLHSKVCDVFAENPSPFMEIACGPGMGLTPTILTNNPQALCLSTDACSLLIKSWRKYIDENLNPYPISLASFSALDIPLHSESLHMVTSYIGISSTRAGEAGRRRALKEVHRVLKKGGYFITVENEWTDLEAVKSVFDLWGKPLWAGLQDQRSWKDKFRDCGFTIENCEKSFCRKLHKTDNDLGEQADKFGIDIGLRFTLYILRKFTA